MNTQLLREARHLPPRDQIELIAELWDGLTGAAPVLLPTEEQRQELDNRLALYLENPGDVKAWAEVKASALEQLP